MNEIFDRSAWLSSLKPGDEVAVSSGYRSRYQILRVERRTNARIYLGGRTVWFRSRDGAAAGESSWNRARMEPITDEIRAEILAEHHHAVIDNFASQVRNGTGSAALARAVAELIEGWPK